MTKKPAAAGPRELTTARSATRSDDKEGQALLRPGAGDQMYFVPPFVHLGPESAFRPSETMTDSQQGRTVPLFVLPEYSHAFKRRFDQALHHLVREKSPVLREIPTERTDRVRTTHVTAPSGEVVSSPPILASLPYRFIVHDVTAFNLSRFAAACDEAAEVLTDTMVDSLVAYTHRISDAFGTATSAGGQPFGWPVLLKGLEKTPIDFNDCDEPILPFLVSSRDKRNIVPYPSMSTTDKEAFDALMALKREEFHARRRTRELH